MFNMTSDAKAFGRLWVISTQITLVLAVLIASLGPAPGKAALYVSLGSANQAQGIAWARRHGGTLLGPGPLPGSVLLEPGPSPDILSAAAEGALLFAVVAPGCGLGGEPINTLRR